MAAGGWRYLAERLTGEGAGELIDLNLPLADVSLRDNLSGPSEINGSIGTEVARLMGPDGKPLLTKWQTAIYAEHQGRIRAGAILTDVQRQGPGLSVTCTGFTSYPDGQPWIGAGYTGVKVDPLDVAREIWDHLQGKPYGDLGVILDRTTKSPIRIGTELKVRNFDPQDDPNVGPTSFESGPVLLRWYETHDLGEEFVKLAEETPFDYHERHEWDGDRIKHYLDFGYPRIGRKREDLRFVIGENIAVLPQIESDEYATEVLALGRGEGRTMYHAVQTRPGQLRRAIMVEDKSARQKRINALAARELAWRTGMDDISSVVVRDHPHARVGSVQAGDEILIEGDAGWGPSDMWVRVASVAISPEEGDAMELTVIRSDKAY